MTANRPIGVFDSGVGGLTVLTEIRRELPAEDLLYVADSGHAPYGDKSPAQIEARAVALTEFLIGQGAKAVVVACNTATGAAARLLRARYPVPIIAMELPARGRRTAQGQHGLGSARRRAGRASGGRWQAQFFRLTAPRALRGSWGAVDRPDPGPLPL